MSDQELLAGYVDVWWQAVGDLTAVLEQVPDEQWSTPTDLAGWDVRAVASHTAHLERVLATGEEEHAEVGEPVHASGMMGRYTEIGVVNRRTAEPAALLAEIREMTGRRHDALRADPPRDASAPAHPVFGGLSWTWGSLLRNRPLDVWMHEQDVRRAVGLPGGLDSEAAAHSAAYLVEGFGFVLAKKVQAPPGTRAALVVQGHEPCAFEGGEDGRGRAVPDPTGAAAYDVTLRMDRETYVVLAGGRRPAGPGKVDVVGDQGLGREILARMATTP
ncbi:MAG: maleylpyruvate isomerase family mycothiol-dependent enzyme [Nocardioides sp.]|nr:maleylpyruvate isomerase family mycothiol-dependent enzyme [Nocardioides sp.]